MRRGLAAIAVGAGLVTGCGTTATPAGDGTLVARPDAYAKPLGMAAAARPLDGDDAYRRRLLATATSITPENAMKWGVVQPAPGRFAFEEADALAALARATGKRLRGHTLVWDQQLPPWVGELQKADVERALVAHVRAVAGHFRGAVESWDVVNEPFEEDGSWTRNVFYEALGPRYVELALRAARAADPNARLFVNELAAERPGLKRNALLRLAADLKARGVPLDGVGLQNHTTADDPPNENELREAIAAVAALGLDTEITEMDVTVGPGRQEEAQAAAYAAAARACALEPRCTGLTVWGVTDTHSWLGAANAPLPYDATGRVKPALQALRTALRR